MGNNNKISTNAEVIAYLYGVFGRNSSIYTVDEVTKIFNVHRNSVYRWIKEGYIRYVKMPGKKGKGRIHFTPAHLVEFLMANEKQNPTPSPNTLTPDDIHSYLERVGFNESKGDTEVSE